MCSEHSWSLKLHRNVISLYFQGEILRGKIDWIIFSPTRRGDNWNIIEDYLHRCSRMLFFLFWPTHWESQMKALRALLHLQNHYCQQKSIADLEVVTSIHLFIFRHFAIQLRGGKKLLLNFHSTKFSFNKSFNKHIKVSWRCYIRIPLLFIMNPSSPSVNTRGNCLAR